MCLTHSASLHQQMHSHINNSFFFLKGGLCMICRFVEVVPTNHYVYKCIFSVCLGGDSAVFHIGKSHHMMSHIID